MVASIKEEASKLVSAPEKDAITAYIDKSWDELWGMQASEVADYQLASARQRFQDLLPQVKALQAQAENAGITQITRLDDLVPLLFSSDTYKSYPVSFLEKGRFDLLTKWMGSLTTVGLSGIDWTGCEGIDDWLARLEAHKPLAIVHTSGTSGKLSFMPRTTLETGVWMQAHSKLFASFGSEPGGKLGGPDGIRLPVVYPMVRYGRATPQLSVKYLSKNVAPTPDQVYTLTDGTLSADVLSLAGRIRIAQARGDLAQMQISPRLRDAMRQYLAESEARPKDTADFITRMSQKLKGQRVMMACFSHHFYQAAVRGLADGIRNVFAPDSFITTGGGSKDAVLPEGWMDTIREYTGVQNIVQCYGMTEMGPMPICPNDHFHVPPYYIPFLLDPVSGAVLPRQGTRTGRFAFYDLTQQTLWGGGISGDKVTITWDQPCGCGRNAPYIHNDVTRYPTSVSGDDKILCSATVDNTDAALQQLLAN